MKYQSSRWLAAPLKWCAFGPFEGSVTKSTIEELELAFGSEFPTARMPGVAESIARAAAKAKLEEEEWYDSEAPTGVAAERPLLPPPPRAPRV